MSIQSILADLESTRRAREALYKHFHRHPELSLQEHRTAERIEQELRGFGIDEVLRIGSTGVVAILRNGDGPVVAMRGDIDGLPMAERSGVDYAAEGVTQVDEATGEPLDVRMACIPTNKAASHPSSRNSVYSVHSLCTTHSQSGWSWSGIRELNVQPFPAPWQSMTTISVAPAAWQRTNRCGAEPWTSPTTGAGPPCGRVQTAGRSGAEGAAVVDDKHIVETVPEARHMGISSNALPEKITLVLHHLRPRCQPCALHLFL